MDKRLILTITIIVAFSGIFVYMQDDEGQKVPDTEEGRMEVPEMDGRYVTVLAPEDEAETPVSFRFDANTSQADEYVIIVDGDHAASGELQEQNLEKVDIAEGEHTYTIQLLESGDKVDETSQKEFKVVNGTRIELISPVGDIDSGEEVEFVYSVNGSETAELFLDGEKMAEKEAGDITRVKVESIEAGEHVWTVKTGEGSKEQVFDVEKEIDPLQIHSFDVVDSDEGWRARADLTAQVETEYTVYVDNETVEEGMISEGEVSLGIPIELDGEHAVQMKFRNTYGETSTDEVVVDAR